MAYSKITIDFGSSTRGTILSFTETNLNIFFIRDFQKNRLGSQQVAIPVNSSTNYEMTTFDNVDIKYRC
jgi:hypothetical protein